MVKDTLEAKNNLGDAYSSLVEDAERVSARQAKERNNTKDNDQENCNVDLLSLKKRRKLSGLLQMSGRVRSRS